MAVKPSAVSNTTAAKVAQVASDPFKNVRALLEGQRHQIARALPKHMPPERLIRIATTELSKNPKLLECDPISFIGAIIQCAQLGLEPGSGLGHAYLVPFFNGKKRQMEVQFIPGYRGLIDLARRSGQIVSISARVVYEGDHFEYEYGLEERLVHRPARFESDKPGEVVAAYAVAKLKDGGVQFEVMERWRIDRIRTASKNPNPVWESHFDEMARKTVIRNLFKYLPVSIEIASLIEADDRSEVGDSQDNAQFAIDIGIQPVEAPIATAKEIGDVARTSREEEQRLQVLERVEARIASKISNGGDPIEIEKQIGMALAAVIDQPTERLLAIYEVLK